MRQWIWPFVAIAALFAFGALPRPIGWTLIVVMAALFWYFVLTAFPHSRRWKDIQDEDHRRDSPRSSR